MTTVPSVADGQLIATSWGNTVASVVNVEVVRKDGATMTGILVLPAAAPTGPAQAANKAYVDTKLPLSGGNLTGQLDMNDNPIIDLPNPTADGHAARKKYVDDAVNGSKSYADNQVATRVRKDGDAMTGDLNMNGKTVWGLRDPTAAGEAANRGWCSATFAPKAALDELLARVAQLEAQLRDAG